MTRVRPEVHSRFRSAEREIVSSRPGFGRCKCRKQLPQHTNPASVGGLPTQRGFAEGAVGPLPISIGGGQHAKQAGPASVGESAVRNGPSRHSSAGSSALQRTGQLQRTFFSHSRAAQCPGVGGDPASAGRKRPECSRRSPVAGGFILCHHCGREWHRPEPALSEPSLCAGAVPS